MVLSVRLALLKEEKEEGEGEEDQEEAVVTCESITNEDPPNVH